MVRATLKIAVIMFFGILACGKGKQPYNVMIIAVDTLRPDHLGCYGYHQETSPHIDNLAASGVRFDYALSQAPWTLPSFSTVFTSLYPSQHGANNVNSRMRSSFPTLASILKEHGYATGAIVNAAALKPAYRVSRGFDFYYMTPPTGRVAEGTTRDALHWIDSVGDSSFFIFVHYFDPHLPYSPPHPYSKLFDPDYHGRIGDSFNLEGFSLVRDSMFVQMKSLSDADWRHIVALYDGEIAFTDSAIGELLRGLEQRGLRGNTLIVFLSDHGEEFFEHGGFEHGHTLYDDLLWVPLLFSFPGHLPEGRHVGTQVRLLDVAPTILDLLGIDCPPHFEGSSLVPLLRGNGIPKTKPNALLPQNVSYAEAMRHGAEKKSITSYPWKLIYSTLNGKYEIFNLEHDRDEMINLDSENPPQESILKDYLFSTLFGISDTWYLELGSSGKNSFDIEVVARRDPMAGTIWAYRMTGNDGKEFEVTHLLASQPFGETLKFKPIKTSDTLLLAFKTKPSNIPITFNLSIDDKKASGRTYIGSSHLPANEIPLTLKPAKPRVISEGRPEGDIEAPYFLIWYDPSPYSEQTHFILDEETKRELRSLGYIQ